MQQWWRMSLSRCGQRRVHAAMSLIGRIMLHCQQLHHLCTVGLAIVAFVHGKLCMAQVQEDKARERAEGGFVTFRQQASFGLHLLVMMGTFYAMGHVAGGALTGKPTYVRDFASTCMRLWDAYMLQMQLRYAAMPRTCHVWHDNL
jgi:hypothetical protein